MKKFKLSEVSYSEFFDGPLPDFESSVIKRKPKGSKKEGEKVNGKKKQRGRPKKDDLPTVTPMPGEDYFVFGISELLGKP